MVVWSFYSMSYHARKFVFLCFSMQSWENKSRLRSKRNLGKCTKKLKSFEILANYENQQFPQWKEASLMEMISSKEADESNLATSDEKKIRCSLNALWIFRLLGKMFAVTPERIHNQLSIFWLTFTAKTFIIK